MSKIHLSYEDGGCERSGYSRNLPKAEFIKSLASEKCKVCERKLANKEK